MNTRFIAQLLLSGLLGLSGCAVTTGGTVSYRITTNPDGQHADLVCLKSSTNECYFNMAASDGTVERVLSVHQGESVKISSVEKPVFMCVTFTQLTAASCEGQTISHVEGNTVFDTFTMKK